MHISYKTIGIVDWYKMDKGYGVLKNLHDGREYFIHHSEICSEYKYLLSPGDIVIFSPKYDQKRNRETAFNIHFFNKSSDVKWAIDEWINEDYLQDTHLKSIISTYLKDYDKDESFTFKDAYNNLIEILLPFFEIEGSSNKLFSILRNAILSAFEQSKNSQLIELTYLVLMEKLPSKCFYNLLDSNAKPYTCFIFAINAIDYKEKAILKAIDISKSTRFLLDDLVRFVKDINEQTIKDSLDSDKSFITDNSQWKGISGEDIVSYINTYIFTYIDTEDLKSLIRQGYIHHLDNSILKREHPDCYKDLKVFAYKTGVEDAFDFTFFKDNIGLFSASDLTSIKQRCQLSDKEASTLFLCYVKNLLQNEQNTSFNDILLFSQEIPDIQKWLTDNHSYLADKAEDRFQDLLLFLYKSSKVNSIDINFILYNISHFSIAEVFNFISTEKVNMAQRKKVISALFKNILEKSSNDKANSLLSICSQAKELLNGDYSPWLVKVCSTVSDEDNFFLWENKISEIYPSSYIREKLLTSDENGYKEYYNFFLKGLVSLVTASNELWDVLNQNQEINNRPTFYKILYCIKYLLLLNNSYKEGVKQKRNDYYSLILWFLTFSETYSEPFEFETLRRLFIYFLPSDQVRIIKFLFYLAEDGKIQLTVGKLDSLLRIDADLYRLISAQNPEIPIDVSSEIIIKALVNFAEKGNFSSDKDVLNIVIQAAQHNKNADFKIGSYFHECTGQKLYKFAGNRRANGRIKQINELWFCVIIFPYFEAGFRRSWNPSFHEAVNAVKSINGRRWNDEKNYWEVPTEEKEHLFNIAYEFDFEIVGSNNSHLRIFRIENNGKPADTNYCEGRLSPKKDDYVGKDFLWCRNKKCFSECVKEHSKEEWEKYTLLDFCRVFEFDTDSIDSRNRNVKYGKYLAFSSMINRANTIIKHLYCRDCGEMLEPVEIANFAAHLVTNFHCTNPVCKEYQKSIYISKCFNWKCSGVIDDRDQRKCPNGWTICPDCGSCCSNRIFEQRITNCNELGIRPSTSILYLANNKMGHLEKREFYCWKCGVIMENIGGNVYSCPTCGVIYERSRYDYVPNSTNTQT